jgi:hypothetical protein
MHTNIDSNRIYQVIVKLRPVIAGIKTIVAILT